MVYTLGTADIDDPPIIVKISYASFSPLLELRLSIFHFFLLDLALHFSRLDGCEFEWTLGVGDGQGGLACCDSWGCKESDTTERLNWTELNWCHFLTTWDKMYERHFLRPWTCKNVHLRFDWLARFLHLLVIDNPKGSWFLSLYTLFFCADLEALKFCFDLCLFLVIIL